MGRLCSNIIIIYCIKFIEYNIHMLREATAIPTILSDSPQENIMTSSETKNEGSEGDKTVPKPCKRVINCDILSS